MQLSMREARKAVILGQKYYAFVKEYMMNYLDYDHTLKSLKKLEPIVREFGVLMLPYIKTQVVILGASAIEYAPQKEQAHTQILEEVVALMTDDEFVELMKDEYSRLKIPALHVHIKSTPEDSSQFFKEYEKEVITYEIKFSDGNKITLTSLDDKQQVEQAREEFYRLQQSEWKAATPY